MSQPSTASGPSIGVPRGTHAAAQKVADNLSAILSAPPEPLRGLNPDDPRSFDFLKGAPRSQTDRSNYEPGGGGVFGGGLSAGKLAAYVLGGAALAGVCVACYWAFVDDGGKKRKRK